MFNDYLYIHVINLILCMILYRPMWAYLSSTSHCWSRWLFPSCSDLIFYSSHIIVNMASRVCVGIFIS